jgi:hypothetical protein
LGYWVLDNNLTLTDKRKNAIAQKLKINDHDDGERDHNRLDERGDSVKFA